MPSRVSDITPSAAAPGSEPALRRLRDLPGPRPWPLVGNALQVRLHRMHQDLARWADKHGPLFKVQLGGFKLLVVSDAELIGQLLRARPDTFRRPSRLQAIIREMGIPDGVFVAEGSSWERQRRMVMASFAPQQVRAYFPALLGVAQRLEARWTATARAQRQGGPAIDLQADLMRFTVDAIAGLAFGTEVNTLGSDGDVIQQHLDKIFPAIWRRSHAVLPYWQWLKLPADRALDESLKAVIEAIRQFMTQGRARLTDPARRAAPPNMLEALLVAADQPGSGMSDDDVAGNVFTMLLAGEDTTATSLSWMLDLLWRHPQALRRARDEVDRVLGARASLQDWTPDDLAQLDWLEACIHESMRLKPVGPFNVVEALQDTVVGDVGVRRGTPVLLLMRHDTVREEVFARADEFLPQRWLPEGSDLTPAHARKLSMPFGSGPRICPGRFLALLEIKLAAAMLLSQFDILSIGTPDGTPPEEHMALTMVPLGLQMRLQPRSREGAQSNVQVSSTAT
jgi:cytochrome P450